VPLTHQKVGTLGPWEALSVAEVQNLVDHVYEADKYIVAEDNVWFGLVHLSETKWFYDCYSSLNIELSYCLNNWHNGFTNAASESVKAMISDNANYLKSSKLIKDYIALCLEKIPINQNCLKSRDWQG
jgi:hypothetical protein